LLLREERDAKSFEDDAEFLACVTPGRLPVMFGVFVSRISCITLIIFIVFNFSFRDTVADYSLIKSLYVWNLILAYI
jgi:hypothetical protein